MDNQLIEALHRKSILGTNRLHIIVSLDFFLKLKHAVRHVFLEIRLSSRIIQIEFTFVHTNRVHKAILSFFNPLFIFFCTECLYEFVRILVRTHVYNFCSNSYRVEDIYRTECCFHSSSITIVAKIDILVISLKCKCILLCKCSTK